MSRFDRKPSTPLLVTAIAIAAAACGGDAPALGRGTAARALTAASPAVWMPVGPMSTPRSRHSATLLPSGLVLVAGGVGAGGEALATAELYDPATGSWSPAGAMSTGRYAHTATLLASGEVMIAGGSSDATVEIYDPVTGRWSARGSSLAARYDATATLVGPATVLLVGGDTPDGIAASAELYDAARGTSTAAGSLSRERWAHTATLLRSGQVLVAGGRDGRAVDLASAELFDPATRSWTETGSLGQGRKMHAAALLPSGRVLVAGGYAGDVGVLSKSESYDPATGRWTSAGDLAAGHLQAGAVLLATGEVLVAGGSVPETELFDPATAAWRTTASMSTARAGHTTTLLPDGTVLVAGGGSATAEVLDLGDGGSALAIWPLAPRVDPGGALRFTATGGSGSGYAWSLRSNPSGGAIDPATGAYAAGPSGGVLDVVEVADSRGNVATRPVVVAEAAAHPGDGGGGRALAIVRSSPVPPRGTAQLSATGGTGSGYTWSFATNASGGSLTGSVYRAGPRGGVVDVVTVTDPAGNRATDAISVTAGVSIVVPGPLPVQPEGKLALAASGGSGAGFRWSMLSRASLGAVDPATGEYAAGPLGGGVDLVQVVDSLGNVGTASIGVAAWRLEGSGGCASSSGTGPWTAALLLGAVVLARAGARRRRALAAAAAGALAVAPGGARGLDGERLQPQGGAYDILGVQSALVPPHLAKGVTAWVSYADRPLQLVAASREVPVVRGRTTLAAGASIGLLDRAELSLVLPFAAQQVGSFAAYAPGLPAPGGAGLGDVRIAPKLQLLAGARWSVALAVPVTLPTGDASSYLGRGGLTASPRLVVEREVAGRFRVAGNAGVALGGGAERLDVRPGNAVTCALGAELPFRIAGQRFSGAATLGGEAPLDGRGGDPGLEAIAGVTWHAPFGLSMTVGAGSGLTSAYGVPRYRALSAIAFTPGAAARRPRGELAAAAAPADEGIDATEPPPAPQARPGPEPEPPELAAPAAPAPAPARALPRTLGTIRFAFDSARVPDDATPLLDAIAAELRGERGLRLDLEGHADQRGPANYNQLLSERRARAVKDALARRGVDGGRVEVAGHGARRPADPGRTRAAYARNRRVECLVSAGSASPGIASGPPAR